MTFASIAEDVARKYDGVVQNRRHAVQLVAMELARRYHVSDNVLKLVGPAARQVDRLCAAGLLAFIDPLSAEGLTADIPVT